MSKLLLYYAHPAQRFSHTNAAMALAAQSVSNITFVDLYAEYPRHNIDADREQARLLDHEVILFQFPLFWYATPSLVKEWQDLVLEHGFAYGAGGTALDGKTMMLAITAAGSAEAYTSNGYQHYPLRTFLTPLEQTARLCKMRFPAPYVMYGSLHAVEEDRVAPHAAGYARLLAAIRDGRYDFDAAMARDVVTFDTLPLLPEI